MRTKLRVIVILSTMLLLFIATNSTAYAAVYPAARFIVLSEESDVTVTFQPFSAGYNNQYGLMFPFKKVLGYGHNTAAGTTFNLGRFPAGTELIFYIDSPDGTFLNGPGSRNPDGLVHSAIIDVSYQTWRIGFEDLWNGGDRDYDDVCLFVKGNLIVDDPKTNQTPVAKINGSYNGKEGTPVVFSANGSFDPDGASLTYRWDFDNDGVWDTPSSTSNTVNYTWNDDFNGTVKLEVSDGTLVSTATTTVSITNEIPVINAGNDIVADERVEINFSGSVTDSGSLDTHTIDWDFGDGTKASGIVNPTHIYQDHGTYTVTMKVSDDDGGIVTDTLTATINHVNRAPVLGLIGSKSVDEAQTLSFSVNGSDPDMDILTFSASAIPSGAIFDSVTRTFSWTPTYEQAGIYTVHFEVSDGNLTNSEDITIIVNNIPPEKIIDNLITTIENMNLPAGVEKRLTVSLENAIKSIENANSIAATNQMESFINKVEAMRGKQLTNEQAEKLINMARIIIDNL